ncbi:hypothetical protein QIG77_26015, partial [Klebsiella pneumoniae]|nr:hypothetical protein [Klebsiella pneumoniae]
YVTDVTDRVDIDATAGAVTGLTSRVSTAEGAITSQSQQLTNLQNSLNTTNSFVNETANAETYPLPLHAAQPLYSSGKAEG